MAPQPLSVRTADVQINYNNHLKNPLSPGGHPDYQGFSFVFLAIDSFNAAEIFHKKRSRKEQCQTFCVLL
jgi:hypothetical protein